MILRKIWILEAINYRKKSQIIIIKITKLLCQLTIFVPLPAAHKKGKKKKRNLSFCNLCWSHEYYPFIMPLSPGWLISYSLIKDFEVDFLWCSDQEKKIRCRLLLSWVLEWVMSCYVFLCTSAEPLETTLMLFSSAPLYGLFQNLACQTWKHKEYGMLKFHFKFALRHFWLELLWKIFKNIFCFSVF